MTAVVQRSAANPVLAVRGVNQEMPMKNRVLGVLLVLLFSAMSSVALKAQNNCSGNPAYGTCAAPAAPPQIWCAGNNSASTCSGGTTWVGFSTTSPAAGSWTNEFEGIDAASIENGGRVAGAQADPNGAVGPTDAFGVGQCLEFSANSLQAFDKATGKGIFANEPGGLATPQPQLSLFSPDATSYCNTPSLDGTASYDRIDGVFFYANISGPHRQYYLC